ncbi:site-specific integrase [Actinokineospora sp. NBRC 105648]|uniref:tyrosine-type recombinase/integrase n=1 Tax=Actinokineospora sp. NBRC 105648 TaxID=3032206 RepID=UPI00255235E8|nr:site-specific integrase [Actinokineospora sp. NBRC 105648]
MRLAAHKNLAALGESWLLHLRAERKGAETLTSYGTGLAQFLTWCASTGTLPAVDRPTVGAWIVYLIKEADVEPATARTRHLALRRFSAWLADEGETPRDELLGLKQPKLDDKVINPLTDDELQALVRACQGPGYRDRRDEAIVRVMLETGVRGVRVDRHATGSSRPA